LLSDTLNAEARCIALDTADAPWVADLHTRILGRAQERIEYRVCIVGDREELARLFPLQLDAKLSEELHSGPDIEAPQHLADGVGR
jgi:hypothetical protein